MWLHQHISDAKKFQQLNHFCSMIFFSSLLVYQLIHEIRFWRTDEKRTFLSVLWFLCAYGERLSARMGVFHWKKETEEAREKWVRRLNLAYSASHELWPHVIRQRLEHINFHILKCHSYSYQESCTQMIAINLDLSRQTVKFNWYYLIYIIIILISTQH